MNVEVSVASGVCFGNALPLTVIAGMNVLEAPDTVLAVARELQKQTKALGVSMVFKASFDKANRSRLSSARGPGLRDGLALLSHVKATFGLPVITDVHEISQVEVVAEVADIIQVPAFLVRQTDLLVAASASTRPVLLKKMQMMAPHEMGWAVEKCMVNGAKGVLVCERGTTFGYGNLVVDPLSFPILKALGVPVVFDVTHALQTPGSGAQGTGGRGEYLHALAAAGVSQGIAGLFFECHPRPSEAHCDGASALPLSDVGAFLNKLVALDQWAKDPTMERSHAY